VRSIIRILGSARELWPYYAGIVACSLAVAATGLLTPFISPVTCTVMTLLFGLVMMTSFSGFR
jgi:hypothetical protein